MLFSLNYLKQLAHLPSSLTDEEIIAAFNALSFEVEAVHKMPKIEGIKFGKVLKTYKNPNGDNLTVCEIHFSDKKRIIQTTATNVKDGQIIIAFIPGSKKDEFEFGVKTLKNIVSEGMLTSVNEFGLNNDLLFSNQSGINHYEDISDLTLDPIAYLSLNDTIVDLAILPNRADANSYYIMALELAAFFHTKVNDFKCKEPSFKSRLKIKNSAHNYFAMIEATNNYELLFSEQVLLSKSNFKVSNDINDLANLTFLMTGQPVNVYDKDLIGQDFKLDFGAKDEIILINKEKVIVNNSNLLIYDNKQIINLAGINQVDGTKAYNESQKVIFGYGQFDHVLVRENIKTTKHLSSITIQAGKLNNLALMHLVSEFLMTKLQVFSTPINLPHLNKLLSIKYEHGQINEVAGFALTDNKLFIKALNSLKILGFKDEKNIITPPPYRFDIITLEDLCEEIFRFYNYNNFVLVPPISSPKIINDFKRWDEQFVAQGFNEIKTYLLTSHENNLFNPLGVFPTIKLISPISILRAQIRNSIITSFQEVVTYHLKQKNLRFDFYEISQIHDGINVLGLVSSYRNFNEMKYVLSNVFGNVLTFKREFNQFLHPGISANIYYKNKLIGYIGQINPHLFNHDVIFVELKLNEITQSKFKYHPFIETPLKSRDITVSLKQHHSIEQTINIIQKTAGIVDLFIVDKFNDKGFTKVTLRIVGQDAAIAYIDENFN